METLLEAQDEAKPAADGGARPPTPFYSADRKARRRSVYAEIRGLHPGGGRSA